MAETQCPLGLDACLTKKSRASQLMSISKPVKTFGNKALQRELNLRLGMRVQVNIQKV